MTTNASIGHGTLFALLNTALSPDAYVTIAEVNNITPPALARDVVEATHTESTDRWREYVAGLRDAGEVTLELNFIPGNATFDLLVAALNSDTASTCRITFDDGSPATVWGFTAFLTAIEPEAPVADKMTASVTFKLTGKPAFVV